MNTIVTYIEHSCFLVETTECYLLFDYYGGEVPLPDLDPAKPLLLFSSHAHHDHFSRKIFALRDRYPSAIFVLSADIPVPKAVQPFACPMLPHEHRLVQLAGGRAAVSIDTLRSNDEGVAFIIQLGALCIYHAGDLNNWWWDGDVEDQKLADIYHEELEHIRGRHFTAAFIPLDPRLKGWWKGIEDFMHYADADAIFPMHNFGEKGLPRKFLALDCTAGYKNRVFDVEEPLTCWAF
ncbi:MAG: MBL fold metallo-hydrolase [Lachnospiraceae bacterium]|nr:MBL fold metallo-hydrolase [Lachnospiraceae bacterium]